MEIVEIDISRGTEIVEIDIEIVEIDIEIVEIDLEIDIEIEQPRHLGG